MDSNLAMESPETDRADDEGIEVESEPESISEAESSDTYYSDSTSIILSYATGTIGAFESEFDDELRQRQVFFVTDDDENQPAPSNMLEVKDTLDRPSQLTATDDEMAKVDRRILKLQRHAAGLQSLIPKFIPFDDILDNKNLVAISNERWDKNLCTLVSPTLETKLATPRPEQAVGFSLEALPYFRALDSLRPYSHVLPSAALMFPVFTVEGGRNCMSHQPRNSWNAAIMLHSLFQISKSTGSEEKFLGRMRVLTLAINRYELDLCGYWAEPDGSGGLKYYGKKLHTLTLIRVSKDDYITTRRYVHNAFNWLIAENYEWINGAMGELERRLEKDLDEGQPEENADSVDEGEPITD